MECRNDVINVNPTAIGFPEQTSMSAVRIIDHLTPKMQTVVYEAKRFKNRHHSVNIAGPRIPWCIWEKMERLDQGAKCSVCSRPLDLPAVRFLTKWKPLVTAIWLKPMWCSAFCSKQRIEPMNLWLLVLVFYHRGLETRRSAVVKLNFSNPSLVLYAMRTTFKVLAPKCFRTQENNKSHCIS